LNRSKIDACSLWVTFNESTEARLPKLPLRLSFCLIREMSVYDNDQLIAYGAASATQGSESGFANAMAQASGTIPTPIGGSIRVPQLTAASNDLLYASANEGWARALGTNEGQSAATYQYSADPNYSQNLIFHGDLFVAGTGGFTYGGDGEAGGIVGSYAAIGNNWIQLALAGPNEWVLTGNVNGVTFPQNFTTTGNVHVQFTVPITDGGSLPFVTWSSDESYARVIGTGFGQLIFDGSAAAWGYVDGESVTPLAGDFNHDGVVDAGDYGLFAAGNLQADGNLDGVVNSDDFDIWAANATNVIIVSNPNDELDTNYSTGDLSLREALALANDSYHPGTDTIVFDPAISNITLSYDGSDAGTRPDSFEATNVDILGPGADKLSISGGNNATVFNASNSTFESVTITGGGGDWGRYGSPGGGINGTNITVRESRITGNTAFGSGGGVNDFGSLHVIDSEISDNVSEGDGGGIFLRTSTEANEIEIVNSTISGNQATGNGGGIFNYEVQYGEGLSFNITNSTISSNTATNGGGVYNFLYSSYEGPFSAPPKINNTIIAGNSDGSNSNDIAGGSFDSSSSHNLIGYDPNGLVASGNGNIRGTSSAIDPHLAPLDFYGGKTKTHALLSDSDAIDAGDNDFVDNSDDLAADVRGLPYKRIVDWYDDLDPTVDIGAVELALGEIYS
jgi:hypothetical protein